MVVAKKQHIKLWTAAPHLEMRNGKRACGKSIGPLLECGSFDLQKLASLQTTTSTALLKVVRGGLSKVRAAVGGLGEKWSCQRQGACTSGSIMAQGVVRAVSFFLYPKKFADTGR